MTIQWFCFLQKSSRVPFYISLKQNKNPLCRRGIVEIQLMCFARIQGGICL